MFKRIKKAFSGGSVEPIGEDYVEIDLEREEPEKKVQVKLFVLKHYDDVTNILAALRQGFTIVIIDFKILKQKDSIELKRAVSKIKKTVDALDGSIAGHDNIVIATPSFAKIYKEAEVPKKEKEKEFY